LIPAPLRWPAAAAALILLFIACFELGGAIDPAVAAAAGTIRAESPAILYSALFLTNLGSAPMTLGVAVVGAIVLVRRRQSRAVILLVAVIIERLAIDGLKLFFGRARPLFDDSLVHVNSLSFPSGHAANSLTAWLLAACLAAPAPYRRPAIIAAIAIAVIVGATRVLLGVHWLSDVVGGWAAGLLAVMLALAADRRLRPQEQ
jgi:membrane-associated phospholipid phosphatase